MENKKRNLCRLQAGKFLRSIKGKTRRDQLFLWNIGIKAHRNVEGKNGGRKITRRMEEGVERTRSKVIEEQDGRLKEHGAACKNTVRGKTVTQKKIARFVEHSVVAGTGAGYVGIINVLFS